MATETPELIQELFDSQSLTQWVRQVHGELKRLKQEIESLDPNEDRYEYYDITDRFAEELEDLCSRNVVGAVPIEVIDELDQLIDQPDDAELKGGGTTIEFGRMDTTRTSSRGQNPDEELQELRANRRAEMEAIVKQIEEVYHKGIEADWLC